MNICVQDNECWLCQSKAGITSHHAIPQYLKPKKNICVPICHACHQKINNHDVGAMFAYAFKLEQLGEQTRKGANKLKKIVEEFIEYRRNKQNNKKTKMP